MSTYEKVNLSDEALCALARQQDSDAEDTLVRRFTQLVRVCARPLFLFGGDSEDLTQVGMIGLINAIRKYSPDRGSSFRSYAELCIRRSMLTAIRDASGQSHSPLNASVPLEGLLGQGGFDGLPDVETDPEILYILKENLAERLKSIRSRLSSFEKEVFERYLKGFTCGEISAQLNRSAKSVDNAIQRIKRKVLEDLNEKDS